MKTNKDEKSSDIRKYIQLDYNKFSPTFGKYIVKKNDILLRERNSSIYAPQRLDTEVSYLATGIPNGERDYNNNRIISFDKPNSGYRETIDKFPHSFQTLHGNYTPGCKKKRLKHAVRRKKEVLDVPLASFSPVQGHLVSNNASNSMGHNEIFQIDINRAKNRSGLYPLLRRPRTASGSASVVKLPKGYFLQAAIKDSTRQYIERDGAINIGSNDSLNQLQLSARISDSECDINEASRLDRPHSASSSVTSHTLSQSSHLLNSSQKFVSINTNRHEMNQMKNDTELNGDAFVCADASGLDKVASKEKSDAENVEENPFQGDEEAGIILDDEDGDGTWSGLNSLRIEQLQQQQQLQLMMIPNCQNSYDTPIADSCNVLSNSIAADGSENNYHLSYQGSSLSFEYQPGSSESVRDEISRDAVSVKSEWEPTQRTNDGNYKPYNIEALGRRTAPRDMHNDAINSAEIMDKSYIQDFVLQSMRQHKGQTRRSVFATEMGEAIRADTIRIQKQIAHMDDTHTSTKGFGVTKNKFDTSEAIKAIDMNVSATNGSSSLEDHPSIEQIGNQMTWGTIAASVNENDFKSYTLINGSNKSDCSFTEAKVKSIRPSSAQNVNIPNSNTIFDTSSPANHNIFAAAVDPVVLLSNSTITQKHHHERLRHTIGNLSNSSGGPIACIPNVGNVHLVLKSDGGMHSLQLTGAGVRTEVAKTRPVSANGHIPVTSTLQAQLIATSKGEIIEGQKSFFSARRDNIDISKNTVAASSAYSSSFLVDNFKSSLVKRLKEKISKVKDIDLSQQNGEPLFDRESMSAEQAAGERRVLDEFFHCLRGWRWRNNSGWRSLPASESDGNGISQRYGISFDTAGFVREINLPNNNLKGTIPDSIKYLSHLEVINLDGNAIGGLFPGTSLSKLTKLEVLSLRDNNLSGDIPWINLSYLGLLRELWLTNNRFSGSLAKSKGYLGEMKNLSHLCIAGNKVTGELPGNELKYLNKLQLLSCGNNRLTGPIPVGLQACYGIANISLHNNKLSGKIPPWIGNFEYLMELNLFNNNFDGYVPRSVDDFRHVYRGDLGSLCDIDESSRCTESQAAFQV